MLLALALAAGVGLVALSRATTEPEPSQTVGDQRDPMRPGARGSTKTTAGKTRPGRPLTMRETAVDVELVKDSANREDSQVRLGTIPANTVALEGGLYLWPQSSEGTGWERSLCLQLVWERKIDASELAYQPIVASRVVSVPEGTDSCNAFVRSMVDANEDKRADAGGDRKIYYPILMVTPAIDPQLADLWIYLPAATRGQYLVEGTIRAKHPG